MGLFDSTTRQTAQHATTGDAGVAVTGGGQNAMEGAIALGTRATLNTGLQLGTVRGDVQIGDGGQAAREISALFADTLQQSTSGQTALVDRVLQSVTGLAETKATDGENLKLKIIWWAIIAGAALGAVWLFRRH